MPISSFLAPSAIAKPGVCTSSTRPASPYEGQFIYETDTDKTLVWNGSAWYAPWNLPWGIVAYTKTSTSNITYTSETTAVTSSSFTAVANRYYRATYIEGITYGTATSAEGSGRLRLDSISGTMLGSIRTFIYSSGSSSNINVSAVFTTTAGAHTVLGTLQVSSGTGTAYRTDVGATIWVEDIGPV